MKCKIKFSGDGASRHYLAYPRHKLYKLPPMPKAISRGVVAWHRWGACPAKMTLRSSGFATSAVQCSSTMMIQRFTARGQGTATCPPMTLKRAAR